MKVLALAIVCAATASAYCQNTSAPTVPPGHWTESIPDGHWAKAALEELAARGLISGYPTGGFQGPRQMTRYELAVTVHAAYLRLRDTIDGLSGSIDAIKNATPATKESKPVDLTDIRNQLQDLMGSIANVKAYGKDIENLQKLTIYFEKELNQLGVDTESIKTQLNDLNTRVSAIEKKRTPVDISGDVNLWMGAGNSRDDYYGLNKDGRIVGTSTGSSPIVDVFGPVATPAGLTRDATILFESAFTFTSTSESGPKWHATFVSTNMLSSASLGVPSSKVAFGDLSGNFNPSRGFTLGGYEEAPMDTYFQEASVVFGAKPAMVEVGRLGYKISPYLFQRQDNTSYFSNERWDDGKYRFDGVLAKFRAGVAGIDLFAGNSKGVQTSGGLHINPINSGPVDGPYSTSIGAQFTADQLAGAKVGVKLNPTTKLNLSYLLLDGDGSFFVGSKVPDRLEVMGADANASLGKLKATGAYGQTTLKSGSDKLVDSDNQAWNLRVDYASGRYGVFAGYRDVAGNYLAPGDWGRVGVLRNPTNLKGWKVGGFADVNSRVRFSANSEFATGKSDAFAEGTLLNSDSKVNSYELRLDYRIGPAVGIRLAYEDTLFRDMAGAASTFGNPRYRWTTVGLDYAIGGSSRFSLQYELSDVDNDYQVTTPGSESRFRGGFLTSQLTIKF